MSKKDLRDSLFQPEMPNAIVADKFSNIGVIVNEVSQQILPYHACGSVLWFFRVDYIRDVEESTIFELEEIAKAVNIDDEDDDDDDESSLKLDPSHLLFQTAPWAFSVPGKTALSRSKKIIRMIKDGDFKALSVDGVNLAVLINRVEETDSLLIYIVSEDMGYTTIVVNEDEESEIEYFPLDNSTDLVPVMVRELKKIVTQKKKKNLTFERIINPIRDEESKKTHERSLSPFIREDGAFDIESALQSEDAMKFLGLV